MQTRLLNVQTQVLSPVALDNELQIADQRFSYRIPTAKRAFDILFASVALLLLSPLLITVAVLIRLDSKGPIFYASKRVGTGFKIFDFYKFRSMRPNADKEIDKLKHLNQYGGMETSVKSNDTATSAIAAGKEICMACTQKGEPCSPLLYLDHEVVCERTYLSRKNQAQASSFIKIKNDPRVTKLGRFIRNTSIDELPQLINVLKGDMSIVGNRPLPVYEAETLTQDLWSKRFLAPAGLTGLWQISKRGKGNMSDDERRMLDNTYADTYSLWLDLKIILSTFPALVQKENV